MTDADDKEKKREKALKDEFKPLTKWWKDQLGSAVDSVKVSNRLTSSPCIVVTSQFGWSANMERIVKAQAMADNDKQSYMKGRKTLEINPKHPMIAKLKEQVDSEAEGAKDMASVIYDTALLESGFELEDTRSYVAQVHRVLKTQMGLDPEAQTVEDE